MLDGKIWVLGATGRVGRAVAASLVRHGHAPVLVGRDQGRLQNVAKAINGEASTLVSQTTASMAEAIRLHSPAVVINTIGPFGETALPIVQACLPTSDYVDLSNELFSVADLLKLHSQAEAAERTIVTGAGYGVLATECLVLKMCADQPTAEEVRVDAVAAVELTAEPLGHALASSIVDGIAAGTRTYVDGRIVKGRLFSNYEVVQLPDGRRVGTAAVPFGELASAQLASHAPNVVCGRNFVPSNPSLRAIMPLVAGTLFKIGAFRQFAKKRIAKIVLKPKAPKEGASPATIISWSRARVRWSQGESREEWMRTGDAHDFTVVVLAEVAVRLYSKQGKPGAYTPGSLFGWQLAKDAGGSFFAVQKSSEGV